MADVDSDREAIVAVRNILRTYLEDPRQQYTSESRIFVHTDKPLVQATFPRIQVRKRGPSASDIIDIGPEFLEWRSMILDIQFWTSTPFKWQNTDNTWLQDEELCKEWLHKIWTTLKAQLLPLRDNSGITGLKMVDEEDPFQEADSQLYTGIVSVRIWYFQS